LAACAGFDDAQSVLQYAPRGGLTVPKPKRSATPNLTGLPRDGFEMVAEHFEHPIRIAGDLELGEIRIFRKDL
jgi:hypothetical protein